MKEFKKLNEETLYRLFLDEELCRQYISYKRWQGKIWCTHCNYTEAYKLAKGIFRCKNKLCKKDFSIIKGTIFEGTKVPLTIWIQAIYLFVTMPQYNALKLHQRFAHRGLRYESAWFIHHRIMELFKTMNVKKTAGVFEFDELYNGANLTMMRQNLRAQVPIVRGRGHKTPILAVVNRGIKLVGRVMPANTNKLQTQEYLKNIISPQSTAYSDCSPLYHGLDSYFKEYKQFNHSKKIFGDSEGGNTQTLNNAAIGWKDAKRNYKGVSLKYLQRYWDEFCFRYNQGLKKQTDLQKFERVFKYIERPITNEQLEIEGRIAIKHIRRNIR